MDRVSTPRFGGDSRAVQDSLKDVRHAHGAEVSFEQLLGTSKEIEGPSRFNLSMGFCLFFSLQWWVQGIGRSIDVSVAQIYGRVA